MDFETDFMQPAFWDNFYGQGGFGMYPVTFWGFLLLLYASLYLLRPQLRFLRAVVALAFLTLASGTLGTAMGFMISFRYAATVAPDLAARTASYGCAMSLHVVILALILAILGGIITAVGMRREARQHMAA